MSAAVTATLNTIREKVRSFLSEKNTFTNILETIEIKSNKKVSREYIFYGKFLNTCNKVINSISLMYSIYK